MKNIWGAFMVVICCLALSSAARAAEPAVSAGLFTWMAKAAHLNVDRVSDTVVCGMLKGSDFCVEFPEGGIANNTPFLLTIEGETALVALEGDQFNILDGSTSIGAFGLFTTFQCLLSTIADMLSSILSALLSLNIIKILYTLFYGTIALLICIFS